LPRCVALVVLFVSVNNCSVMLRLIDSEEPDFDTPLLLSIETSLAVVVVLSERLSA